MLSYRKSRRIGRCCGVASEIFKFGKAEWYGWDDAIKANSKDKWNYNLGFKPGAFNNMQECLEFIFNNNTVESVKQYQLEKTQII